MYQLEEHFEGNIRHGGLKLYKPDWDAQKIIPVSEMKPTTGKGSVPKQRFLSAAAVQLTPRMFSAIDAFVCLID